MTRQERAIMSNINRDNQINLGRRCADTLVRCGLWTPTGHEPEPLDLARGLRRLEDVFKASLPVCDHCGVFMLPDDQNAVHIADTWNSRVMVHEACALKMDLV